MGAKSLLWRTVEEYFKVRVRTKGFRLARVNAGNSKKALASCSGLLEQSP